MWGCSSKGLGNLVRVHGIVDSEYQDILNQNLSASAKKIKLGHRWIFHQDNDQKHMSRSTQKWLTEHKSSFCHGHLSPLI